MKHGNNTVETIISKRREDNQTVLDYVTGNMKTYIDPKELYRMYTGIGGLHDLEYNDFDNYYEYSESKKEIEQGQFFTPDSICKYIIGCVKPTDTEKIADITCGKGSFFHAIENKSRLFGCEIQKDTYDIASFLFPQANIYNGSIEDYELNVKMSLIVGNPPFNLKWVYDGKKMNSQIAFFLYAANFLEKGGVVAAIVPNSFGGELTSRADMKKINSKYHFIGQIPLDANTFSQFGVNNFGTKIVFLQKTAKALGRPAPYQFDNSWNFLPAEDIYDSYLKQYRELDRRTRAKLALEENRDIDYEGVEFQYKLKRKMYQVGISTNISDAEKDKANRSVELLFNQVRPEGITDAEWFKRKVTPISIMSQLDKILSNQHVVEEDKIQLVKTDDKIYYKGYSVNSRERAVQLNTDLPLQNINELVSSNVSLDLYGVYRRLLYKKRAAFQRETQLFTETSPDIGIYRWLKDFSFTKQDGTVIKLNQTQLHDTTLILSKHYAGLQWEQGGGKTLSAIAVALYRLKHNLVKHVFTVSTALAIVKTWKVALEDFGIPYRIIRKPSDLRKILPGEFVLLTIGRVLRNKRQIQNLIKLCKYKGQLIFDESQYMASFSNSTAEGKCAKAILQCFHRLSHKLLCTGTCINNSVIESYSQFYLLYNGSANMQCRNEYVYKYSETYDEYTPKENAYFGYSYPPYADGYSLFSFSHLPKKLTVFGVVKRTPQIFNKEAYQKLMCQAFITRTFEEITGKDIKRPTEILVKFNDAEKALYNKSVERFSELEHLYYRAVQQRNSRARKKAQSDIIAQIMLMLRIANCASRFPEYNSNQVPSKILAVGDHIAKLPNEYIVVGARMIDEVKEYEKYFRERFPGRAIYTVTGSQSPQVRAEICLNEFKNSGNGILICTQQSLAESISIDFVNHIYLVAMHWNNSKMAQFYHRFIRYTSTGLKYIYYVNNPDTLETNLMFLLAAKEQMLLFAKGYDLELNEVFVKMGFSLEAHKNVTTLGYDKDGKREMTWSKQTVA